MKVVGFWSYRLNKVFCPSLPSGCPLGQNGQNRYVGRSKYTNLNKYLSLRLLIYYYVARTDSVYTSYIPMDKWYIPI